MTTRRSCRRSTCSRRSSTTPTTTGASRRRTRSPTCSRWAASRSSPWPSAASRAICPTAMCSEILRGGADVALAAGAPILGGHTITAAEPLYGLAVTGLVHPGPHLAQRGRPRRRRPRAHEGARHGHRRERAAQGRRRRRRARGRRHLDDDAQPLRGVGVARAGPACGHRRDGIRAARAPARAVRGIRRARAHRRRRPPGAARRRAPRARGTRTGRLAAQPHGGRRV